MQKKIRFIDLFAGLGGTRIGFERAAKNLGLLTECVFTSEIKTAAVKTYSENFNTIDVSGDITKIKANEIPDFDCLLAGFPCQPFSYSGKREGFLDTRGTLFFEIERILKEKKPKLFLLENVEGLVNHDKENPNDHYGRTLKTIVENLTSLGYKVSWKVLNAADFGVPQDRKRIYITGSLKNKVDLNGFVKENKKLSDILEKNKPLMQSTFIKNLLLHFKPEDLLGKAIKDKRGGDNNIHSWDFELKGNVTILQREILNQIFKERRKKKWALIKNIKWMDGMPLTLDEIYSFIQSKVDSKEQLKELLDDLIEKGYLKLEHPKDMVTKEIENGVKNIREYSTAAEKGYNIVTGKLSFEISKVLDPEGVSPTLVATDMSKIAVVDGNGLRRLTVKEGLRLFGFPEEYKIEVETNKAYDLLGNSIVVPVVEKVSERLIQSLGL